MEDVTETPPESKKLTKGSWRSKPKWEDASTPSLGSFRILRVSSDRVNQIERSFPTDAEGRCADPLGYMRGVIAEAVVDVDGQPVLTTDDIKNELTPGEFWELWDAVGTFLGIKRSAKN